MSVSLTPELEQLVRRKVETGRYRSASDVLREALRLLEERDRLEACRRDEIRSKVAAGMASLHAGESVDGEAFIDRLEAEIDAQDRRGSN